MTCSVTAFNGFNREGSSMRNAYGAFKYSKTIIISLGPERGSFNGFLDVFVLSLVK